MEEVNCELTADDHVQSEICVGGAAQSKTDTTGRQAHLTTWIYGSTGLQSQLTPLDYYRYQSNSEDCRKHTRQRIVANHNVCLVHLS